ncbi:MAG: hypothetical protein UX61_C0023G0004 [Parcubacteria group bacterium GW2011_GWA2_46_7]|nr:MAG: hypothetical protein UX61_C0023G0004 [Parcubacteria group bacterium GW2011_GWA2_46_7]
MSPKREQSFPEYILPILALLIAGAIIMHFVVQSALTDLCQTPGALTVDWDFCLSLR